MKGLLVKRIKKSNLNEGPEMFLFRSKTNDNFIKMQCKSIQTIGGHFLQRLGHIKLYSHSGAMLNYSIITGGLSSQMRPPLTYSSTQVTQHMKSLFEKNGYTLDA